MSWTLQINGEADDLFFTMLSAIPAGYVVDIDHRDLQSPTAKFDYRGNAEWVRTEGRSIVIRAWDPDLADTAGTGGHGPELIFDCEGLDKVVVL